MILTKSDRSYSIYLNYRWKCFLILLIFQIGKTSIIFGQDVVAMSVSARKHLYETWDFDSVEYYFERVIGKKHTPAFAYSDYGWYLMLIDRYDEGMKYIQKAALMSPQDRQLVTWNSWAFLWDNDLPKAEHWIDKALAIDPDYGEALHVKSQIASAMGKHQEALELAKKATDSDPSWRADIPMALAHAGERQEAKEWAEKITRDENVFDVMLLMVVYATLGNDDKALEYVEKSFNLRHPFMPWLALVPGLEHLHHKPRFKTIMNKLNLP